MILSKKGKNWVTYRGIMRSDAVKKIIPLRKNLFGHRQYYSDWHWLVKVAQEGELIRVPEVLYTKHNQPTSYSETWKYSFLNYFGSLSTCSAIIWRFPLGFFDKFVLQLSIFDLAARYLFAKSGLLNLYRKVKNIRRTEGVKK